MAARRACSSRSRTPRPPFTGSSTSRSGGKPAGKLVCVDTVGLDVDTHRYRSATYPARPSRAIADSRTFPTRSIRVCQEAPMRKVKANFFISLDGVVESPDKWHFPYFNDEMGAAIGAGAANVGA